MSSAEIIGFVIAIVVFVGPLVFYAGRYTAHRHNKTEPKMAPAPVFDVGRLVTVEVCKEYRKFEDDRWTTVKDDLKYIRDRIDRLRERP